MFLLLLVSCLPFFWTALAHSQYHRNSNTVWEYLSQYGSKTFVSALENASEYDVIESTLTQPNITFFLPDDAAFATAVGSGVLNLTNTNNTLSQVLRHIVTSAQYDSGSLLHAHQYLSPNDSATAHLPLVVGPAPYNASILQVASGIITANVVSSPIVCSNGIIHMIDQFLQPPKTTMETIEGLEELQTHQQLMKSLNLTTVVSGPNKTVLAPINQAWAAANSSSMPYGTLVHNLKYQVIDGIFLQNSLYDTSNPNSSLSLLTSRRDSSLTFEMANPTGELLVIGKSRTDVARIQRSDIITTEGVIHLVDRVLSADLKESGTTDSSSSSIDNAPNSPPNPDKLPPISPYMPASGGDAPTLQSAGTPPHPPASSSRSGFDTIPFLAALSPPLIALFLV